MIKKYIYLISSNDENILRICISQIVEHPFFKDYILLIHELYVKKKQEIKELQQH